jgi:lipopolysaccharide transport system permease protein
MTDSNEYVIEPKQKKLIDWHELWSYHELFYFFTWRDIKVKYKQAVLGVLWVVLQPLLTVLIFTLFFGRALNVNSQVQNYPVFVFSGLLLWNVFSSSVLSAGNSMISNAQIIKKIYFPRIIIPVSSILTSLVDFVVVFVLFVLTLLYVSPDFNFTALLWWPVAFIMMLTGTLGISCWLAALSIKYKDFRYIVPFGLQVALFLSPVIYPIAITDRIWLEYAVAANPMYGAITMFRIPFMGIPSDPWPMCISFVASLFFVIVGLNYFNKTEAYFADIA